MRILFIGTGEIGLPTLRMLSNWPEHKLVGVVTQPDKPAGRDQKLTSPSPKQAVQNLGLDLPVLQPDRIKSLESVHAIRALKPDAPCTTRWHKLHPKHWLRRSCCSTKKRPLAFHKKTSSPLTRPSSSAKMAGSIGANPPKQSNEKSVHSIRGRARSWKLIIAI